MKIFLKNLLLLGIAIVLAIAVYPQYSMSKTIKFAQLSDLHVSHRTANSGNRMHINSFDLAKDAIEQINSMPDLDFVVITGDGVDSPKPKLFEEFAKLISTIKKPYYYSLGNHDTNPDHKKEKSLKALSKYNPYKTFSNKTYYSTTLKKDFKIIILDASIDTEITNAGYIDKKQLDWLDNELKNSQDKVVLIFLHYPLEEPFASHHHRIRNKNEVDKILYKYSMPMAVFSGHYHSTKITQKENIIHASCPSMIMYPNAFRVVTVKNDKDKVTFKFEYKETTLRQIQQTSKLLTLSDGLTYGKETDRNNTIIIYKKEQKNVQK